MQQYFEIGEIVNTHGVRGELKVIPLTDDINRYDKLDWVYIRINGKQKKYDIEGIRYHKNNVLLSLKGVNDMNSAELLKGCFVEIPRELAIKLPEGSYFIADLVGCSVLDDRGKDLGKVEDVIETGSNDVYVVRTANNKQILIPAIKEVVLEVDVENKIIKIKQKEGLIDYED